MNKKSAQTPPQDQPGSQANNQSATDIHIETHTESHASSGGNGAIPADQPAAADELTADLQRLQAEFVNYRRRAEAERADVVEFAKSRVIREFLTVRDNFDRELAGRPKDINPTWATSIDAIRTQFDQVLTSLGVERFESKGQPFDPHLHEAIAMEDGEGTHDVVTEELQPGYKLGSNILRHAVVKVGKTTEAPAQFGPSDLQSESTPTGEVK